MRVLIVDDQALLRESLSAALASQDINVVGSASSTETAVEAVHRLSPDVVLLDVQLSPRRTDVSGFTVAKCIRSTHPSVGLLMLSVHDEPVYLERLLDLDPRGPRAIGYLVKDRGGLDALAATIVRISNGEVVFDPLLVQKLARRRSGLNSALTAQEQRTLSLVAEGLSNKGIAARSGRTLGTIEQQLNSITTKLDLPIMEDPARQAVNVRVLAVLAYLGITPRREAE